MQKFGMLLAYLALLFNLGGGIAALFGVYLIAFGAQTDMAGLGEARSLGYLFVCVGLCVVASGVLIARHAGRN
ncbi:MAG: hypothetical protein RBR43_01580 [Desulfuromonadaceae bacterium]|nr:hypothetical protein [Desulfuromonas sp.]MDY0184555.1 hypothetical protein [Desulfuromonadaceae bacterium]